MQLFRESSTIEMADIIQYIWTKIVETVFNLELLLLKYFHNHIIFPFLLMSAFIWDQNSIFL